MRSALAALSAQGRVALHVSQLSSLVKLLDSVARAHEAPGTSRVLSSSSSSSVTTHSSALEDAPTSSSSTSAPAGLGASNAPGAPGKTRRRRMPLLCWPAQHADQSPELMEPSPPMCSNPRFLSCSCKDQRLRQSEPGASARTPFPQHSKHLSCLARLQGNAGIFSSSNSSSTGSISSNPRGTSTSGNSIGSVSGLGPAAHQQWASWRAAVAVPDTRYDDDQQTDKDDKPSGNDGSGSSYGGDGGGRELPDYYGDAGAVGAGRYGGRGGGAAALRLRQQPFSEPQADDIKLPVKAYHIGGSVDFQRFASDNAQLIEKHQLHRDHVVMELADMTGDTVLLGGSRQQQADSAAVRVLAVYNYGSAVFFNSDPQADRFWLDKLKEYVKDPHKEPLTDETTVVVRPGLDDWFVLEPDHIVMQMLDLSNVRVISSILGQSVALDHFDRLVIAAIERFTPVLTEIANKGVSKLVLPSIVSGLSKQLMGQQEDELLKLIGESSLLHTDVVYKLGLLHPTDVAWRTDKYYDVWKALHADYDIEKRFEALKAKLGPLLANAKFVLEVREDKKSERSELIIILLIGVEIVLHVAGWYM